MAPASSRGIKSFDFYRKVPLDLTEATWHGGLVSILAMYVRAWSKGWGKWTLEHLLV